MKIFTLFELQSLQGYHILKHILNDAEIQIYYNTPSEKRAEMLANKSVTKTAERVVVEVDGK
jgi:hypothetical protein